MNNKKTEAIIILILVGLISTGVIYGVCLAVEYFVMAGVRTEEQCRELTGTLADNPENAEYLKIYPEDANILRSESCLEGVQIFKKNILALKTVFPIFAGVMIPFIMSWIVWPSKESDK